MNSPAADSILISAAAAPVPAVCIVGPLPPPSGGMANQCEQLVHQLREVGVAVELVRTNPPSRPHWIGCIPVLRAGWRLFPYLLQVWRAAGRAEVMHVLANSGWAWHLFAAPAVWIARVRNVAVIVNYHGGNADAFFARTAQHVLFTLHKANVRVTPSGYLRRVFARYGLDARVIPNGVDLARFAPAPERDFGAAPHLIVTRNLEAIYDIPTAIRAFAIVRKAFPSARLTVAGSGPEKGRLSSLVDNLGLSDCVHFPGRIDNADIGGLYARADCMLNPSTVDNMPIAILEAFASGVPVVTTDAGGIPDMVEDGITALLVPVGDHVRMGEQTVRLLTARRLLVSLREAGIDAARAYAWPAVRQQWLRIYGEAAQCNRETL